MRLKQLIFWAFTVFVLISTTSTVYAAGETCCNVNYSYSDADGLCHPFRASLASPQPTNCEPNEICVGFGLQGTGGVCSEPGGGDACCELLFAYRSDGLCHQINARFPVDPVPPKCPTGTWCSISAQTCLIGIDTSQKPIGICQFTGIEGSTERAKCEACVGAGQKMWTPFGCIETEPQLFIQKILKIAIGVAGGIAFLMIVYGGFVIMTSVGNPERLTQGKEIVTSAIAGLLLIVFSVILLKIIGVDILQIPGLG